MTKTEFAKIMKKRGWTEEHAALHLFRTTRQIQRYLAGANIPPLVAARMNILADSQEKGD